MEKTMESVARDLERTCRRIMVLEALVSTPVSCCCDYNKQGRWADEPKMLKKLKGMLEVEQALIANRLRRD